MAGASSRRRWSPVKGQPRRDGLRLHLHEVLAGTLAKHRSCLAALLLDG
jgi:hypothetical protein